MTTTAGAEHAYLFDAQLLMLDDAMLVERAVDTIRNERLNAESALQRALDHISAFFDEAHDPYLRERKGDVADVVGRLTMNLRQAGDPTDLFRDLEGPLVLVAHDVTPSLIAQLDWSRLAGTRHRRGKLDESHGDSGAIAAGTGGRRIAQRQRSRRAGHGRGGGWHDGRDPHRS